jgi:hypothetical protein
MSQLAGTTFGIGTPGAYAPVGLSPYAAQGLGLQPIAQQYYGQPFATQAIGGYGIGAGQPLERQQVLQILQILPQQLQQVQFLQQQQLLHLQQLLQTVPAQLQQLVQIVTHQVQHLQQQSQPYGQVMPAPLGFGLTPQPFGGQTTGQVM